MLYHPPSGSTDPNAPYVGKNVAAGTQGSKVPPGALEFTQREIVNAIESAGMSPSDGDLFQLWKAMRSAAQSFNNSKFLAGRLPTVYGQPGSYTLAISAGTTFEVAECRGAGGGGGGASGSNTSGSGGGGGGSARKVATATANTVLSITIGAGGTGGAGGGAPGSGSPGGSTYITIQSGSLVDGTGAVFGTGTTLCAATGGGGGSPGTNSSIALTGGANGVASGGDLNDAGGGGGTAVGPVQGGFYVGGLGGLSPGIGQSGSNQGTPGVNATAPGIGGTGSAANGSGGSGAAGRVIIYK